MKLDSLSSFFLLFFKEKGISSAHALNKLKRIVGVKKAGYCGTLDPLAEGLLIVAFNKATKLIRFATLGEKSYSGTMLLGKVSDSYDDQTEMRDTGWSGDATAIDLAPIIDRFRGEIIQVPPVYSALKIGGRRACDLARQGKSVKMKERMVMVNNLTLDALDERQINFKVECSKGTYVRSLVHDIGEMVGSGAVMTALTRESVGPYRAVNASKLSETEERSDIKDISVVTIEEFLSRFPKLQVNEDQYFHLRNGKPLEELDFSIEEGYSLISFEGIPKFLLQREGAILSYTAYLGEE